MKHVFGSDAVDKYGISRTIKSAIRNTQHQKIVTSDGLAPDPNISRIGKIVLSANPYLESFLFINQTCTIKVTGPRRVNMSRQTPTRIIKLVSCEQLMLHPWNISTLDYLAHVPSLDRTQHIFLLDYLNYDPSHL